MNYDLSDHRSPQRNAPLVCENVVLNAVLSSQAKPHKKRDEFVVYCYCAVPNNRY